MTIRLAQFGLFWLGELWAKIPIPWSAPLSLSYMMAREAPASGCGRRGVGGSKRQAANDDAGANGSNLAPACDYGLFPVPPGGEFGIETPVSDRRSPEACVEISLRRNASSPGGANVSFMAARPRTRKPRPAHALHRAAERKNSASRRSSSATAAASRLVQATGLMCIAAFLKVL
jgi:hypothetical protein